MLAARDSISLCGQTVARGSGLLQPGFAVSDGVCECVHGGIVDEGAER